MNVQRFLAPTSREAMAKARSVFGDSAVILSSRSTGGGFEVVATAEEHLATLATHSAPAAPERRAERNAATEHLAAAAQTAAFNTQNADDYTRHAARSAQYGEAAAHALARLDREEQHWQQRLDQYSQARAQQGDGAAALQQLRQQLFSADEQPRVDAALALRKLQAATPGS